MCALAIVLNDSHTCLLAWFPAICHRNDEEPDVRCTGSGEHRRRMQQHLSEAEVNHGSQ